MITESKTQLIAEIDKCLKNKAIGKSNADLLKKLINNADSLTEAIAIAELGTTYKKTGFYFDKRLDKKDNLIKYFKKNQELSFSDNNGKNIHKLIIGENYDALLNLLIEYKGKIDIIYIDPPYGKDNMGEFAKTNYNNSISRDNLLSMLYPRLIIAKQLLSDTGVIFCSIDDKNQAYVKCLFDEIFDEDNFIANIDWDKKSSAKGVPPKNMIVNVHEYILAYQKENGFKFIGEKRLEKEDGFKNPDNDPRGPWRESNIKSTIKSTKNKFTIVNPADGKEYTNTWAFSKESLERMIKEGRILWKKTLPKQKEYLFEMTNKNKAIKDSWGVFDAQSTTVFLKKLLPGIKFDNPKPLSLMKYLISVSSKKDSLILDFFAGSGTTGQAVLELNQEDGGSRKFILVQTNEITESTPNGIVIDVLAKRLKRIMSGKCYNNEEFEWAKIERAGSLEVYEISKIANYKNTQNRIPFDEIDETLYGKEKFTSLNDKIEWVCSNFENTQYSIETDEEFKNRTDS